jgi:PPM family protein phosphatase
MAKLTASALTDPGRRRQINEDQVWSQSYSSSKGDSVGLYIVCDGIGGHLGGEFASYWALEAVKHELSDLFCFGDPRATVHLTPEEIDASLNGVDLTRISNIRKYERMVDQAIQKANQVVYEYAQQKPQQAGDAGTTISMALVIGGWVVVANVGDSRTYLLRGNKVQQITKDHSLVATLVASGQIKPEDIFIHPQRNLIYRSLGQKRETQVDTFIHEVHPGDYLVLCTDGLWEMVQDDILLARLVLEAETLEQACAKLVNTANIAGGEDNIGVVVVKIS